QTEPAEPQPTTPAELHALALVARDAAAEHEDTDALLPADVHETAASSVQDVRPERRFADRVGQVGDVGDGELSLGLDVVWAGSGVRYWGPGACDRRV